MLGLFLFEQNEIGPSYKIVLTQLPMFSLLQQGVFKLANICLVLHSKLLVCVKTFKFFVCLFDNKIIMYTLNQHVHIGGLGTCWSKY